MEYKVHILKGRLSFHIINEKTKQELEKVLNIYASEGYQYDSHISIDNQPGAHNSFLIFKKQ
jgi:hypothetical protein